MAELPKFYTVSDVIAAGYTLEPLRCLNPNCEEPESGNVTYNQGCGDAYCSICGEDQIQFVQTAKRPINLISTTPTPRDLMETAACLWEQVLDLRERPDVRSVFEDHGTAAIRDMVLDLVEPCHVAYATAVNENGYDRPFDWEFVPTWLSENVEFNEAGVSRKESN